MVILGIDPGLAVTGYGIIEIVDELPNLLEYGVIRTESDVPKEIRLATIFEKMVLLLEKFRPDTVILELLFFNRNTKTALMVGESRGVILLAAGLHRKEVHEYTPLQIKECLTGFGRTKKNEVREMVQIELGLDKPPKPIDASDALATALCHYFNMGMDPD